MDPTPPTPRATLPAATATVPDLSGATFGDFRVLRRLGQGGMGQVYLGEQVSLKRKVAIKVLREDVAATPPPSNASRPSPRPSPS
jgi:serine/threonine protein kinase